MVRLVVEKPLTGSGFEVRAFGHVSDVVLAIETESEPPDLVVTDVIMPGANGGYLAKLVQERWPGVRVSFVSGYAELLLVEHEPLLAAGSFLQ